MIFEQIKNKIEQAAGSPVSGYRSITGGCISQAFEITFKNRESLFLKINPECFNDMFIKEAKGLKELQKANVVRVPDVVFADKIFILMENIRPGKPKKDFFSEFGRKFSLLHRVRADSYGFYENNFIGSNEQINIPDGVEAESWPDFYLQKRIIYQYRLAEENGYATSELRKVIMHIEQRIYEILSGSEEYPSLLHGDLWSGNFITDEEGSACLIDPAVYYGDREADLAMTKLFGGFSSEFYNSYMESYPLSSGYDERENIYKLYHALNHLNLFGNSYYNTALFLAKFYL